MGKKRSKKFDDADPWWWVCKLKADFYGIFRWYPQYNCRDEKECKRTLRGVQLLEGDFDPKEWAYFDPTHEHEAWNEATKRAAKGTCPKCGAKPKHAIAGRSRGWKAFRCGKCGWTWKIEGSKERTEIAPEAATSFSKALVAFEKGSVPKKKVQKFKKGKKSKVKKGS